MKCTHPDHNDQETCEDRAVGCHRKCKCCMGEPMLYELIQEWDEENEVFSNEGRRGVENLCRLVRALGYRDSQHFGQLSQDACLGDLVEFLEDNSGCIDAIKEWIGKQSCSEWRESLESELPERTCPCCGEPLEDDVCQNVECES